MLIMKINSSMNLNNKIENLNFKQKLNLDLAKPEGLNFLSSTRPQFVVNKLNFY